MNTRSKNGFTLAEVITAVGILVIVVLFAAIIFRDSIEAYRLAGANAEIMQKLQTITTELDRDFGQIRKDGLLTIRMDQKSGRSVTQKDKSNNITVPAVWMDRIYYFTTGDFQSQSQNMIGTPKRNNIARIYFGHDTDSLADVNRIPLNQCKLARDVLLITPRVGTEWLPSDCNGKSYVAFASNPLITDPNYNGFLGNSDSSVLAGIKYTDGARRLMCENAGELKIEWIDQAIGTYNKIDGSLNWLHGDTSPISKWDKENLDWPKAIKFTFTLYDSKEVLKEGRIFSHIVYMNEQ